jgi:hypothetical protein
VGKADKMIENITIQQLPQGEDKLSKAKRLVEILKNRFLSVTVEDTLINPEQVEKLLNDLDKAEVAIGKLEDTYEGSEEDADLLSDLSGNCTAMWNYIHSIIEISDKYKYIKQRLNLQ